MAMTLSQLHENRDTWSAREKFRYGRWYYWYQNKTRFAPKERLKLRGKWWNLYIEAREKRRWYDHEIANRAPKPSGEGTTTFDGHPVANWIIPILQWARNNGWSGFVVSGYRTPADQWAAAVNYARELGRSLYSIYPSGPLASNHVRYVYPGGAVDVTNYEQLAGVLRGYNGSRKLVWAGPTIGDYVHFSNNGH